MTGEGTRKQRLFGGWAALALGLLGLVMMSLHPEQLRVPAWVWIAFGPGPRQCSAMLSFISTTASDWVCRGAFGFSALLGLLILFLMARTALRGR